MTNRKLTNLTSYLRPASERKKIFLPMSLVVRVSIIFAAASLIQAVSTSSPEGSSNHAADSCFPVVGCFSNLPPWTSAQRPALPPRHPVNVTTGMYFFSRNLTNGVRFPIFPEINLANIPFDGNKTTFMIFYGFQGNISSPWVTKLKDALLQKVDANILIPDYNMANESYEQSAGNIRIITKLSLMVIDALEIDGSNLHLIGFCCGAHISGNIGKVLKENGNKLARITALEPRKRLFLWQNPAVRLMPDDADFVDVIHTDLTPPKMWPPTGHVDFYFKPPFNFKEGERGPLAHDYYIEAVKSNCFLGQPAYLEEQKDGQLKGVQILSSFQPCQNNSCVAVGLDIVNSKARGTYLVFPNAAPPYCTQQEEQDF